MFLLWLMLPFMAALGQSVPSGFAEEGVASVIAITGAFAPNPRQGGKPMLLLSSKEGRVRVLEDPDNSDVNFVVLDIEDSMCHNGERGLQSIRPHPDFANNQYIYMFYSRLRDGCLEDYDNGPRSVLSRFTMDKDTLMIDVDSETVILETSPTPKRVHNGGNIAFGNDGKLYVTTGDGGSRSPAVSQDLGHLHGSILRLNDDGTIPTDNPYAGGIECGKNGGLTTSGICAEIFAKGLRNPFRLAMDPNTKDKVKFHIGDVGASVWEEISVGGTDYAKANYGWPPLEGPCERNSNTACQVPTEFVDPIYYYQHTKSEEGGCVTGSAFVPESLWPSQYKFLFVDFIFGRVYNLIEDSSRACRECTPPSPGYRNETFMEFKDMVDMFFGPYKDTQALYIVSRTDGQNIRRIRYTSSNNRSPTANITVDNTVAVEGQLLSFEGSDSSDPDGDTLTYRWDFGDGSISTEANPQYTYNKKGQFTVTLTVSDDEGQTDQNYVVIVVGTPPTAEIISPAEGETFFVGEILRLVGFGMDSNGNELNSSQFFWEVQQHHASHFHPFLDLTEGNELDLFAAPEPEDFMAATNSFLKIIMHAVDSDGLTTDVSRIVNPRLVLVDIDSNPQGLDILVDEFRVETPDTITSWESHQLRLDVEDQLPFSFNSWSDGGSRSHKMSIPPNSASNPYISANFTTDWSFTLPIELVMSLKNCSSDEKCGRCEGHCESDLECLGALVCHQKDGVINMTVPGCLGIDQSQTAWCTLPSILAPAVGPAAGPPTSVTTPVSSPTGEPTPFPPVGIPDPSPSAPNEISPSPMSFAPASNSAPPFALRQGDPVVEPQSGSSSQRCVIVAISMMIAAIHGY